MKKLSVGLAIELTSLFNNVMPLFALVPQFFAMLKEVLQFSLENFALPQNLGIKVAWYPSIQKAKIWLQIWIALVGLFGQAVLDICL